MTTLLILILCCYFGFKVVSAIAKAIFGTIIVLIDLLADALYYGVCALAYIATHAGQFVLFCYLWMDDYLKDELKKKNPSANPSTWGTTTINPNTIN